MSAAEAALAIHELGRGHGGEAWWQLAKEDYECGAFVLPLPHYPSAAALFLFERYCSRLRLRTPHSCLNLFTL